MLESDVANKNVLKKKKWWLNFRSNTLGITSVTITNFGKERPEIQFIVVLSEKSTRTINWMKLLLNMSNVGYSISV